MIPSKELPSSTPGGLTNDLRSPNPNRDRLKRVLAVYACAALSVGMSATAELLGFGYDGGRTQAASPISPNVVADAYSAKFVAYYESSFGIKFNVYAANSNKEKDSGRQTFVFNPKILEFSLESIFTRIDGAPENPAKHSIIENLTKIKSGKAKKTIHIVVDTSEQTSCLNNEYDFTKDHPSCTISGTVIKSDTTNSITLITTGQKGIMSYSNPYKASKLMNQHSIILHELIHSLSSDNNNVNTYKEGDHDHEVTAWMIGERHRNDFDEKGAIIDPYRRELSLEIRDLTRMNLLPPILQVVDADEISS